MHYKLEAYLLLLVLYQELVIGNVLYKLACHLDMLIYIMIYTLLNTCLLFTLLFIFVLPYNL